MSTRLSQERLDALSERVAEHIGLHYPAQRSTELRRGLEAAYSDAGLGSARELAEAVLADTATAGQLDVLATYLTIGETYFFRHRQAFDALERSVLPELATRPDRGEPVRIWSAGCSNGPEPYSIAITSSRAMPMSRLSILGADIDRRALAEARRGVFNIWAMRETPPNVLNAYFTPTGVKQFALLPELRDMVTFAYYNLVGRRPSPTPDGQTYDVIFCRNVLMYFSDHQRAVAAQRLQHLLAGDGYLFVAPGEVSAELFPALSLDEIGGTFVFRRKSAPENNAGRAARSDARRRGSAQLGEKRNRPAPAAGLTTSRAVTTSGGLPSGTTRRARTLSASDQLQQARAMADRGQLENALALCDQAATALGLLPSYHFLRATILQELEQWDEATAALKRTLYLDPDFVLAQFVLANVLLRTGDTGSATKYFTSVNRSLRTLPPDAVLPESDGMTARELLEMLP